MSILQAYLNGIRNGDPDKLYRCLSALDSYLDQINASTGGVQNNKVDDPGHASRPVAVPPLVKFTVKGSTGSFLISILNPQSINALTPNQRKQQVAGGVNAPATMLYHQLQSATELSFSANVHLVDHGMSPQTSYSIPDTGNIKYFRVRSSYDQKSWNPWQAVEAGDSGASGLNLQTNGNENGAQDKLNLIGDVTEDGQGNVIIKTLRGLPYPSDKRWWLWESSYVAGQEFQFYRLFDERLSSGSSCNIGATTNTDADRLGLTWSWTLAPTGAPNALFYGQTGRAYYNTDHEGDVFEIRVKAWRGVANFRTWLGMGPNKLPDTILDTTVGAAWDFIGFYFNPTVSGNWQCVCGTNAGMTRVDSGIAVDTVTYHTLRVVTHRTYAVFLIDDVQVATIGENYPTAVALRINVGIRGPLNGDVAIDAGIAMEYAYGEMLR